MQTNFINPTHPGEKQQEQHVNTPLNHSRFDMSYYFDQTMRFGEYTPHFVMDAVAGDKINLRSSHSVRSFTLKSPLMQSIRLSKDYFSVPMECIYPFQWERIFDNPNIGDDVPSDAYGSVDLTSYAKSAMEYYRDQIHDMVAAYDAAETDEAREEAGDDIVNAIFKMFTLGSYIYSNGSLLNYLGCCLSRHCWSVRLMFNGSYTEGVYTFDRVFDNFFDYCFGVDDSEKIVSLRCSNPKYEIVDFTDLSDKEKVSPAAPFISKRRLLELLHDNGYIGYFSLVEGSFTNLVEFARNVINAMHFTTTEKVDLSRVYAYQIVCSHFYSNDRVDYIYSAELWRQNLFNLYLHIVGDYPAKTFTYNGSKLPYDYTSEIYFQDLADFESYDDDKVLKYFAYVFAFRKSLRFVDYFTGAKTSPLAIGDVNVDVSADNNVSVVDITRKIQMQRFLNAVNRMGRKFSNYIKGLFGVNLAPDFHNPLYLGHTGDVIYGQETSNTGEAQMSEANSVTSVLKGNASSHAFEFSPDRPSIIIGITYFDIARHYCNSIDRQFFIHDRFDMYNPFLEYIGDQPVWTQELFGDSLHDDMHDTSIFGYQTRYSEYKQRISRAVGGFVEYLPGYSFLSDNVPGLAVVPLISPDYIRSHPAELDEFYVSLAGDSLSSYFHFIITQANDCYATRPMSYSPQIL